MKLGIILTLVTLATLSSAGSKEKTEEISIECTYSRIVYVFFGAQPSCTLKSTRKITKAKTKVISIDGGCSASKPNPDVNIFYAIGRVVKYIPEGFDVLFPNLIGFRFERTQLTIVTKENLQAFPGLLMFACVGNPIQFLEADLFKYNTKLQYVSFRANRIQYIDPAVFTVISGTLQHLYMDGQALACGLGNAVSSGGIKRALAKMASSVCTDITNAPPLYIIMLELKLQLETCEASEETTTPATEPETSTLAGASDEELQKCSADLEAEKVKTGELQTKFDTCEACRDDPTGTGC